MIKIVVSGLLNIETTLKIEEFPLPYYPINYPFFNINSSVSGVGMNLAKAFNALNSEVFLLSFLGNDKEGERVLSELKDSNIKTDYILRNLQATPQTVVLYDKEGKRQIHCDLKDIQDKEYNFEMGIDRIKEADLLILCNINFNRALLSVAKNFNKLIATDVHVLDNIYDEYNKAFLETADIIFLSDERIKNHYENFIKQLVKTYNPQIVVLGRGKKGAYLYDKDNASYYEMEAITLRKIESTVGAGDALFSSFLNFYIKGHSPLESLKRAEIFASYKIGEVSASKGFLDEESIEELYKQIDFKVKKK